MRAFLKNSCLFALPPVGPEGWSPGNLTHRVLEGRMGLGSRTAYLGGLKEYCMCPQELRSDRQCTQREGGRQRREKDAKCKTQVRNGCVTPSHADSSPRAAMGSSTHQAELTQDQRPCKVQPRTAGSSWLLVPK